MFCNNCGNTLPDDAKFCNQCGNAIKKVIENICQNCGNKLPDGAIFCNACGAKCEVPSNDAKVCAVEKVIENICLNCGNKLPDGAVFCNACGTKCEALPNDAKSRNQNVCAVEKVIENNCLICGNKLPVGATVCNVCGALCKAPTNAVPDTTVSDTANEIKFNYKRGIECLQGDVPDLAYSYFVKAAKLGDAESQFQAASMLHARAVTTKDESGATKWYYKAAMQGHAGAQYGLFRQYIIGRAAGVERNITEAVKWLRMSERNNCAAAFQVLGFLHDPMELNSIKRKSGEENIILPSNVDKAREYYIKAVQSGSENAFFYLSRLNMYIRLLECHRTNNPAGYSNAIAEFFNEISSLFTNDMKSVATPAMLYNFLKKLNGTLTYAQRTPDELPLIIVDSTITGSGKNGLLLTTKALYFKDIGDKTVKFDLNNFPKITSIADGSFFKLWLNGKSISVLFNKRETADTLIFIMQSLVNCFKYINKIYNLC